MKYDSGGRKRAGMQKMAEFKDWLLAKKKSSCCLYYMLISEPLSSGADWCLLRIISFTRPPAGWPGPGGTSSIAAARDSHPTSEFMGVSGSKEAGSGCCEPETGVRARQTSPTLSWRHWRPQRRVVFWGLQEDQPWPWTKNGYST